MLIFMDLTNSVLGKGTEVMKIVTEMFSKRFPSVDTDPDHREKIIEGLQCARQVFGNSNPTYLEFLEKAKQMYPSMTFEKIENNANCVLS